MVIRCGDREVGNLDGEPDRFRQAGNDVTARSSLVLNMLS